MVLLMKNSNAINNTYNLGDPNNEISILDLAKKLIKFSKKNKKILKINKENFSVQRRLPDTKKLIKDTRFKKKSNFEDNLKKTYDWYEKNLSI